MSRVHLVCVGESWSEAWRIKEERQGEARVRLFAWVNARGFTLARAMKMF